MAWNSIPVNQIIDEALTNEVFEGPSACCIWRFLQ